MVEESLADESTVDESLADDPPADESLTDESLTDESLTDDPPADESLTDESLIDDPPADESLTDESLIDDPPADESQADESPCILVVEDNAGDVRLIEEGFDASRVRPSLTVVHDGVQALEYLRSTDHDAAPTPDLVLLDLNVPKMTGIDVLERIAAEPTLRSIPVAVLTGSRAESHVVETARRGADGYFVKPVDPDAFAALIAHIVESVVSSGSVPSGEYAAIDHSA